MQVLPLASTPNQSFTFTTSNFRFDIRVASDGGGVTVSLSEAGAVIVSNTRALAGEAIIPYRYKEKGNFIFLTLDEELPFYSLFGVSQFFVYLSPDEIEDLRNSGISAGDLSTPENGFLLDDNGFYLTEDDGQLLTEG